MTAEQVKQDQPLPARTNSCHTANLKVERERVSADVICNGHWNGEGRLELRFSSPEHYQGYQIVTAHLGGFTVTRKMIIDAHWLAASC